MRSIRSIRLGGSPIVAMSRASAAIFLSLLPLACHATTKGLNQIVTPDVQPYGQLSLSYQQVDPNIGNRRELQVELGVTKTLEIAVFEGTTPGEQIANAELGLYARGPWLLSTGFLNWTTRGTAPQPFIEGGYYHGAAELMAGAIQAVTQTPGAGSSVRTQHSTQSILGGAYRTGSHMLVQLDYQSGAQNFVTAGFTYAITNSLGVNPAIYVTNSAPRKGYGYVVLTWNIQAFGHSASPTTQQPQPQPNQTPAQSQPQSH